MNTIHKIVIGRNNLKFIKNGLTKEQELLDNSITAIEKLTGEKEVLPEGKQLIVRE